MSFEVKLVDDIKEVVKIEVVETTIKKEEIENEIIACGERVGELEVRIGEHNLRKAGLEQQLIDLATEFEEVETFKAAEAAK